MNQQGQIAFPNLNNVTWTAAEFELFQTYLQAFQEELMADQRTTGVLFGGQISLVAGLEIAIAAGAALFSNGLMVTWADQNLTLATADPSNPRIDRVELAYSLVNNSSVLNNNSPPVSVVLDQLYEALPFDHEGTPAGSPAAPGTTSGNISIGLITVPAGAVTLISGNVSQLEDVAFTPSALALGDSMHLLRVNRTRGVFEFSYDGGTTWSSLSGAPGTPLIVTHAMSPYTVTAAQSILEVDSSGGNVVINLPAISGKPFLVEVTKATGDANTVSVTPNGSDTINGSNAPDVLGAQYANTSYRPLSGGWVLK